MLINAEMSISLRTKEGEILPTKENKNNINKQDKNITKEKNTKSN